MTNSTTFADQVQSDLIAFTCATEIMDGVRPGQRLTAEQAAAQKIVSSLTPSCPLSEEGVHEDSVASAPYTVDDTTFVLLRCPCGLSEGHEYLARATEGE